MGYNSWYDLMCSGQMNEDTIQATAAAMKSKGLASLGYEYVNLDDCVRALCAASCWVDGFCASGPLVVTTRLVWYTQTRKLFHPV